MSTQNIYNENENKRASYYDGLYDCPLCLEVFKNPILQAVCGHRFCRECLDGVAMRTSTLRSTKCPVDGSIIDITKIFADRAFEKQLASVNIICCYSCNGCQWNGNIQSLKEHRSSCECIDNICPKGCGIKIIKKDLELHIAICTGSPGSMDRGMDSEDDFSDEEIGLPQSRPGPEGESSKVVKNDRTDSTESGSIGTSINDSLKQCKFNKLGCNFKGNRFEIDLHMDIASERHLDILCKSIQDIKSEYIKKENKIIAKHDKQIKTLQEYITKQNIIIKDLHETNKMLESTTNNNRKIMKDLTNQCDVFTQDIARLKVQINTFQEEHVESIRTSYTGSMLWKVKNVSDHIQNAIEKKENSIFSPIFFTSRYGYRLRAQLFLNGIGKHVGEFLSIFIHILPSEYDEVLKWPFNHNVTFTLLKPSDNCNQASNVSFTLTPNESDMNFQKPLTDSRMNDGKGCSKFMLLTKLKSDRYIKNNSMFIKIKVHCKGVNCNREHHT